jgi:hypothetical protein
MPAPMINIDLSKAFHPRVGDFLAPLLPGFFFEVCVLLASPQPVLSFVRNAGLDRYGTVFVAVLLAFVLGSASLLWVRLLQIILQKFFVTVARWWPRWVKRSLTAYRQEAAQRGQTAATASFYGRFLGRADRRASELDAEQGRVRKAWWDVANELLKRYGVDATAGPDPRDWEVWVGLLGELRMEHFRGHLLTVALEATGWSGLAAQCFAPLLRARAYTGLCLFLVLYGLWHDWVVALHLTHPVTSWLVGLRNALTELKETGASGGDKGRQDQIDKS